MRMAVEYQTLPERQGLPRISICSARPCGRSEGRIYKPEYSQGFNPHMVMSFASAMPVGLCSDSEYFELKLIRRNAAGGLFERA